MATLKQQELDARIDEVSSIKKLPYKVLIGLLFGISFSSALARVAIRFKTRQGFFLDDYLLLIAVLVLIGTVGFEYYNCDSFHLATAVRADASLMFLASPEDITHLINYAVQENIGYVVLAWTTTFFVKFSFLAFFRVLIRQVNRIQRYYWGVVIFTVLTWLFLICEPFIICPHFGSRSMVCFQPSQQLLYVSMSGLITGLDILTDILIVSIPIIILRRAKMRLGQKVALGTFLCLSLVMAIIAIIRMGKITGATGIDITWTFFWQFAEASVAVLMASLTAFRTLLVGKIINLNSEPNRAWPGLQSYRYRMYKLRRRKISDDEETQQGLPEVPGATMTGLRTFIRRNNRDPNLTTANLSVDALCTDAEAYRSD